MKWNTQKVLLIILSLGFTMCNDSNGEQEVPAPVTQGIDLGNVWVIGDSWSACHGDNTWRRTLHQRLETDGYSFDFIGTEIDTDPPCEVGQVFDRDHNTFGGIAAFELLTRLPEWYTQLPMPNNVLLMAGGNDLASMDITQVLQTLTDMVESLRSENPNITVYMGAYSYTSGAEATFVDEMNQMVSDLVDAINTTQSPVYYADLRPNFDPSIHELPDEHPNAAGMAVLGDNWFARIQEVNGR